MDINQIKNKLKENKYWFLKPLTQGNLASRWPFNAFNVVDNTIYTENLQDIILPSDYAEEYTNLKKNREFTNYFVQVKDSSNILNTANETGLADSLSLIQNGFTPMRALGKERDIELNCGLMKKKMENKLDTFLDIVNRVSVNSDVQDELNWVSVGLREKRITPKDFLTLSTAERLMTNPLLLNNLLTKEQLEEKGFILSKHALPIKINRSGQKLYDISWTADTRTGVLFEGAPRLAPTVGMNDFANMDIVENFDSTLAKITKATGIKFVAGTSEQAKNHLTYRKNSLRSIGRGLLDYMRKKTSGRSNAIKDSYTITYPTMPKNTEAEQMYMIIKGLCGVSIDAYMNRTEKFVNKYRATNLPLPENWEKDKAVLRNTSACLIASNVCKMLGLSSKDAKVYSEAFKLEATQQLAKCTSITNNWMMPMISDYCAMSLQSFGQNFKASLQDIQHDLNTNIPNARNMSEILYSKTVPNPSNSIFNEFVTHSEFSPEVYNFDELFPENIPEHTTINTPVVEPEPNRNSIPQPEQEIGPAVISDISNVGETFVSEESRENSNDVVNTQPEETDSLNNEISDDIAEDPQTSTPAEVEIADAHLEPGDEFREDTEEEVSAEGWHIESEEDVIIIDRGVPSDVDRDRFPHERERLSPPSEPSSNPQVDLRREDFYHGQSTPNNNVDLDVTALNVEINTQSVGEEAVREYLVNDSRVTGNREKSYYKAQCQALISDLLEGQHWKNSAKILAMEKKNYVKPSKIAEAEQIIDTSKKAMDVIAGVKTTYESIQTKPALLKEYITTSHKTDLSQEAQEVFIQQDAGIKLNNLVAKLAEDVIKFREENQDILELNLDKVVPSKVFPAYLKSKGGKNAVKTQLNEQYIDAIIQDVYTKFYSPMEIRSSTVPQEFVITRVNREFE